MYKITIEKSAEAEIK